MYVPRTLLLLIFSLFFFTPSLAGWITDEQGHWYRPFIVWFIIIVVAWRGQRSGRSDAL